MVTRRAALAMSGAGLLSATPAAWAQEPDVAYAAADVRADLDALWTTIQAVSPDPFRTSDRAMVEALYRQTRAGMTSPLTVRQAWLAIAPVLGALNDGHVGLGLPGELKAAALRLPFAFAVSEEGGGLIVARDRTGTAPPGARVDAIEGVTAGDFLRTTLAANGGQTRALQRSRVTGSGAWTVVAIFGDKPTYRLRWRDAAGTEHETAVGGAYVTGSRRATDPYAFRWAQPGVGLIDYRRCEDLPRFRAFLDNTFAQLQAGGARALIIDVRRNSGGDSDLNNLLWSYAQARPFKQFGGTVLRSSAVLKQAYGHDKYVRLYGERAWAASAGVVLREGAEPEAGLVMPGPLPLRFTGPVYLLISAETFSSGMSCALAAKDYGLATLVGQETGEPASGTGELYAYTTPNLRLPAYLTTKVFLAPKPHPATEGVRPNVLIPATKLAAATPGLDTVLERTLSLITAQGRHGARPWSAAGA